MSTADLIDAIRDLDFPRVAKSHLDALEAHMRLRGEAEAKHRLLGIRLTRLIGSRLRRGLPNATVEAKVTHGYCIDWSGKAAKPVSPYLSFRIWLKKGQCVELTVSPRSGAELDAWTKGVIAWLRAAP